MLLKKLLVALTLFSSLLLMNCSIVTIQPDYDSSNQYFIEKTIANLNINKQIKSAINKNDKIALVSIEEDYTFDKPIIALVEDELISSLVEDGYNLYERDRESIVKLAKESISENYSIIIPSNDNELMAKLQSADYLVSYRILECGLMYRGAGKKMGNIKREGKVRLHVRIQNTKTSEIVYAKNIEGNLEDELDGRLVSQLADFHYSYFPHKYPLQDYSTGATKSEEIIQTQSAESKQGLSFNSSSSADGKAFSIDGALEFAKPIGDFGDIAGMGIGGSVKGIYPINDQIDATGRVGYIYFMEHSDFKGLNFSEMPIMLGGRYKMTPEFYGMAEVGMTRIGWKTDDFDDSETDLTFGIGAGYIRNQFDFSVTYNSVQTERSDEASNNISLRVGYKFM